MYSIVDILTYSEPYVFLAIVYRSIAQENLTYIESRDHITISPPWVQASRRQDARLSLCFFFELHSSVEARPLLVELLYLEFTNAISDNLDLYSSL